MEYTKRKKKTTSNGSYERKIAMKFLMKLYILAIIAFMAYSVFSPSSNCFTYISDLVNNNQEQINEIISVGN